MGELEYILQKLIENAQEETTYLIFLQHFILLQRFHGINLPCVYLLNKPNLER